jgi:hypothetical protein
MKEEPKPEVLDKPDFEAMAIEYAKEFVHPAKWALMSAGFADGAEKIFNEMVIPLQEENKRLKEQLKV